MSRVHDYHCRLDWDGSTGQGYRHYDRAHSAACPPSPDALRLTADPAFRGDPERLNPEQLLAAASSCQLLSFLAVAAAARIDVVSYRDEASAIMPDDDKPVRITAITLRPHITVRGDGSGGDRAVRDCIERAHQSCFIANSLTSEIVIDPRIEFVAGDERDAVPAPQAT